MGDKAEELFEFCETNWNLLYKLKGEIGPRDPFYLYVFNSGDAFFVDTKDEVLTNLHWLSANEKKFTLPLMKRTFVSFDDLNDMLESPAIFQTTLSRLRTNIADEEKDLITRISGIGYWLSNSYVLSVDHLPHNINLLEEHALNNKCLSFESEYFNLYATYTDEYSILIDSELHPLSEPQGKFLRSLFNTGFTSKDCDDTILQLQNLHDLFYIILRNKKGINYLYGLPDFYYGSDITYNKISGSGVRKDGKVFNLSYRELRLMNALWEKDCSLFDLKDKVSPNFSRVNMYNLFRLLRMRIEYDPKNPRIITNSKGLYSCNQAKREYRI